MEKYEIWRGGTFYAEFVTGDPSRFGRPFDRAVALMEFDDYMATCKSKGIRGDCELRIISKSNASLSGNGKQKGTL